MSELATRVAVALVAIPVVFGLIWLGGWYMGVPLAAFAALGTLEVSRLGRRVGAESDRWLAALWAVGLVLSASWLGTYGAWAPWGAGMLALLVPVALVSTMVRSGPDHAPLSRVGVTLLAVLYVGVAFSFVPLLVALPVERGWAPEESAGLAGLAVVALPLAATWAGDSSAYFIGSAWGRRPMAPTISPKKSWEGFWAALVGAGVAGLIWSMVVPPVLPGVDFGDPWVLGVGGTVLGLAAVVGDLVESLLKREAGVKDSGTFFPGHGGILDRVDSLLFTLPLAYGLLTLTTQFG